MKIRTKANILTLAITTFLANSLVSNPIFADQANYDSTNHILTIPTVRIDDDEFLNNIQLLLSPDGQWHILSSDTNNSNSTEPQDTIITNLTGNWIGILNNQKFNDCETQASLTIEQINNEITGSWEASSNCFGGGNGLLSGEVNDNHVLIRIYSNGLDIHTTMNISSNFKQMTGSFIWSDLDMLENYNFTKQN